MEEREHCAGGCGEELPAGRTGYKYGHKNGCKAKGSSRSTPPPRTQLAKRERPIVIDAPADPAEDAVEYVDCQISVPQLDTIYGLLQPRQKAMAVLNALNEEA
jgi:hypothetical protein